MKVKMKRFIIASMNSKGVKKKQENNAVMVAGDEITKVFVLHNHSRSSQ